MADQPTDQIEEDNPSPALEGSESEGETNPPKRPKVGWQESLITLIASQQEQLAQLARQSNMATKPTPNMATCVADVPNSQMFKLAEFNPDTSSYAIEEWLDDATKLKNELHVGDILMIVKAGEALKGRAHHYYCNWRPVRRTWDDFCQDLTIAFPDRETPGVRAYTAATLRSRDCDSLSDYGIQKLRAINRFYNKLPWNTIVSMVEYGLDHSEAQASIRIQPPKTDRELLKLLSEFDARRQKHRPALSSRSNEVSNLSKLRDRRQKSTFPKGIKGACYNCGRIGHRQEDCRVAKKYTEDSRRDQAPTGDKNKQDGPPTCTHCKKVGHQEKTCWFKHGKPGKILLIRRGRTLAKSPVATLLCNGEAMHFTYVIDSGADMSVLRQSAATRLKGSITPEVRVLSGLSANNVCSIGTCQLIAVLASATIEVLFTVVADDVMPATLDAIIGWDIIGLPHLKLVKTDDGLELHHDRLNPNKVLTIKKDDLDNINVSGLDEQSVARLVQLLRDSSEKTPDHVLTGKLQIRLKDSVPVAYRPRRLAYAERLKVQQIVRELLQAGIVRKSHSEYASPIVLVKKKNGESRMCVDYRDINKKAIKERYPLPLIHDQIDQLSEAKYFTTLDMKSGFHQMEIEEESKHITAFITPDGLYEYNRMPFGYVNSPSVYQRAIDKALGELKGNKPSFTLMTSSSHPKQ
jgi:hypothetical protein